MTIYVPLEPDSLFPSSPSYLLPASDPTSHLSKVVKSILKARRIAVVCGAGISVGAGIPDFRSPDGLFQTIKRENPKEPLTSGKDLFDVSVFNSTQTTSLFCQMIARLSDLSATASPTPFHNLLRTFDDRGRLLRVYTQNIDALELKAGLTFGIPDFDERRMRSSRPRAKPTTGTSSPSISVSTPSHQSYEDQDTRAIADPSLTTTPVSTNATAGPSRLPSPPVEIPRCIPLHGTLQNMYCQTCRHTFPLNEHLPSLSLGVPPDCPECTSLEATRALIGKRPRGVGKLRPGVVLYNEEHRDAEGVGEVARKDLMGTGGGRAGKGRKAGADLLLVVGTSLRVPGTKRIVREFSKAVRVRDNAGTGSSGLNGGTLSSETMKLPTPAPSPRRTPTASSDDEDAPIRTIYLNLDFPAPTREWDGVFDVWIQGDAQEFAEVVSEEIRREEREREATIEKRRKREEEARKREEEAVEVVLSGTPKSGKGKPAKMTPAKPNRKKPVKNMKGIVTSSPVKGKVKRKAAEALVESPVKKKRKVVLIVKPPPGYGDNNDDSDTSEEDMPLQKKKTTPRRTPSSTKSKAIRKKPQSKTARTLFKTTRSRTTTTATTTPTTPPRSGPRMNPRLVPEVLITIPPRHSAKRMQITEGSHNVPCNTDPSPGSTGIFLTPKSSTKKESHITSCPATPTRASRKSTLTPGSPSKAKTSRSRAASRTTATSTPTRSRPRFERELEDREDSERVENNPDGQSSMVNLDGSLVRTLQYGLRSSRASSLSSRRG